MICLGLLCFGPIGSVWAALGLDLRQFALCCYDLLVLGCLGGLTCLDLLCVALICLLFVAMGLDLLGFP